MTKITIKNTSGEVVKEIDGDVSKNLLKQITNAGIEIPSACHAGICGACMCEIESGQGSILKNKVNEPGFPLGENEVMTCIAGVEGDDDVVLRTIY